MNNRGFSSLIAIIIVGVILSSGVFYYINLKSAPDNNTTPQVSTEEKINTSVTNRMRELGFGSGSSSDFKITHVSDRYARGEIKVNGVTKNVYLVSLNDEWKVLEVSEDLISCEKAEKTGFPSSMVSDCLYQYPKAEKVKDVVLKIRENLIKVSELEIIGQVKLSEDPLSNTFEIVSDEGDSITINFSDEGQGDDFVNNLSDGDSVVIDVSTGEDESGEVVFVLNSVEEIETIDNTTGSQTDSNDNQTDNNTNNTTNDSSEPTDSTDPTNDTTNNTTDTTNTDTTNTDDAGQSEQTNTQDDATQDGSLGDLNPQDENYDVTNLTSDNSIDFFTSLIDRDNSDSGVKIISDF